MEMCGGGDSVLTPYKLDYFFLSLCAGLRPSLRAERSNSHETTSLHFVSVAQNPLSGEFAKFSVMTLKVRLKHKISTNAQ